MSKLFTPVTFGPLTLRNRTIRSAAFESMCPGNAPSQMLLSVILLVVYCFAVREEAKLFLLTFILYYIVYLIYETWFFFTYEVGKKQKKEKKNETNA